MLRAEYLGFCKADKFKHIHQHELLVTSYPYWIRQNVLHELFANAVVGDGIPYRCRDIEAILPQIVNELPENYTTLTEQDSRICVKISW